MRNDDAGKDFFEDTPCTVGTIMTEDFKDMLPVYMVDYGESMALITEPLLSEQPFSLTVEEIANGKYSYRVTGSKSTLMVTPKGISMTPHFVTTFDTTRYDHERFQKVFKTTQKWMLVVRGNINAHLIIHKGGHVLRYYETPRGFLRNPSSS